MSAQDPSDGTAGIFCGRDGGHPLFLALITKPVPAAPLPGVPGVQGCRAVPALMAHSQIPQSPRRILGMSREESDAYLASGWLCNRWARHRIRNLGEGLLGYMEAWGIGFKIPAAPWPAGLPRELSVGEAAEAPWVPSRAPLLHPPSCPAHRGFGIPARLCGQPVGRGRGRNTSFPKGNVAVEDSRCGAPRGHAKNQPWVLLARPVPLGERERGLWLPSGSEMQVCLLEHVWIFSSC